MPGMSARFREERHLTLLRAPIQSEGTLYFAPPDRLARHVERPIPSILLVRGTQITVGEMDDLHSLDLAKMPTLLGFVDGLRLLLRGDLGALREIFVLDFEAAEPERTWRLRLAPRSDSLRTAILSVEVEGREGVLQRMRIVENGGDETRMYFSNVDTARRFDDAEIDRLFRAPRP